VSTLAPSLIPATIQESQLAGWHRLHQEALGEMSALALALDRQVWPVVERTCRWVRETLHPHNLREEQDLFPFLEQAGAQVLEEALRTDHREMAHLAQSILPEEGCGRIQNPALRGERARQLLDLIRQHIDTEEHLALPLLQGRRHDSQDPPPGTGYRTMSPYRRRFRRRLESAARPGPG
jgi:iron-sulfur cluster repair protein YtfE (RIC family)